MTDAREIAGRLTKAQREAVLALSADFATGPELELPKGVLGRLPTALVVRGQSARPSQVCPPYHLTPLGLAVRAALQEADRG